MASELTCDAPISNNYSGVALVTTAWVASCAPGSRHVQVVDSFLLYHISIGVARIFVFFDGSRATQPTVTVLDPRVQVLVAAGRIELFYRIEKDAADEVEGGEAMVVASEDVELSYASCHLFSTLGTRATHDVAARQMLHAELAMQRCVAINGEMNGAAVRGPQLNWLMHLDLDELFYLDGLRGDDSLQAREQAGSTRKSNEYYYSPLAELVASLERECGDTAIDQLTVVNYEAVPTRESMDGGNYFVQTTRFRRHTARIPFRHAHGQKGVDPHVRLQFWQQRSGHAQFFLFYDNGKSLVRVGHDVVPCSVHQWALLAGRRASRPWRHVWNFSDPRVNDGDRMRWHEPTPRTRCTVLHYPVCGLEWLRDKYLRLGAFPSVWGGTGTTRAGRGVRIAPCFHLDARDAAQMDGTMQRGAALAALYRDQVRLRGRDPEWGAQLVAGVCEELLFPSELLQRLGFHTDHDCGGGDGDGFEPVAAPLSATSAQDKEAVQRKETDTTSTGRASTQEAPLSVERAWMLAAITNEYL